MICIGTCHDRAEHDWLIGLVLEVLFVEFVEFRTHFFEFFFRGPDFEASIDGVGSEPGFLGTDFPFLEDLHRVKGVHCQQDGGGQQRMWGTDLASDVGCAAQEVINSWRLVGDAED